MNVKVTSCVSNLFLNCCGGQKHSEIWNTILPGSDKCSTCDLGNGESSENHKRNTKSMAGYGIALKSHTWYLVIS